MPISRTAHKCFSKGEILGHLSSNYCIQYFSFKDFKKKCSPLDIFVWNRDSIESHSSKSSARYFFPSLPFAKLI
ncbi:unnamed protein product [Candidatus Protochlamydia amoebophila UWE25]|uniref:Uncharacterized protein n=1 Tax=Protochlamydia amoebophila (strain UWE25) TaxID=264201 RepID=Q6MB61_PARUW|nr:unnamed protein product [Candidatus Protochlamydia amoebophila UWE25]